MYKCEYFGIKELVSPIVYKTWGENSWQFFEVNLLKELDLIRETYRKPILINNWSSGGPLKQCGLRSNLDQLVLDKTKQNRLYLSAHTMGKAFDLHCMRGDNKALWYHIHKLISNGTLKTFHRMEALELTNGWVHTDSFQSNNIVFR